MNRVKSGKTILLNTSSNTTFVASDIDEEVQTGTRENDKHIEWTGELDIAVCEHEYRPISEILWGLLEDIEKLSDDKDDYRAFHDNVMDIVKKRHKYLISEDGGRTLIKNLAPKPDLTVNKFD